MRKRFCYGTAALLAAVVAVYGLARHAQRNPESWPARCGAALLGWLDHACPCGSVPAELEAEYPEGFNIPAEPEPAAEDPCPEVIDVLRQAEQEPPALPELPPLPDHHQVMPPCEEDERPAPAAMPYAGDDGEGQSACEFWRKLFRSPPRKAGSCEECELIPEPKPVDQSVYGVWCSGDQTLVFRAYLPCPPRHSWSIPDLEHPRTIGQMIGTLPPFVEACLDAGGNRSGSCGGQCPPDQCVTTGGTILDAPVSDCSPEWEGLAFDKRYSSHPTWDAPVPIPQFDRSWWERGLENLGDWNIRGFVDL